MPPRDPKIILQKLGQMTLKIDSFFLRRTGFIANQTLLKLGEYNLNCVPATIGLDEARFLAVLTPTEVNLFSRYKEGTHGLILTFDNPDAKDIARFPLRVGLVDLVSVPERKNVCILVLKFKSLPTEFVLFLGAYMEDLEERLAAWEVQAGESLEFSVELALSAGLGYGVVLASGEARASVELTEFHTKRIGIRIGEGGTAFPPGTVGQLRLTFQGHPLNLDGRVEEGAFLPEFHPDWLSFVEEVRFHRNLKNRPVPGKPS